MILIVSDDVIAGVLSLVSSIPTTIVAEFELRPSEATMSKSMVAPCDSLSRPLAVHVQTKNLSLSSSPVITVVASLTAKFA